jgi:hypothetical protein
MKSFVGIMGTAAVTKKLGGYMNTKVRTISLEFEVKNFKNSHVSHCSPLHYLVVARNDGIWRSLCGYWYVWHDFSDIDMFLTFSDQTFSLQKKADFTSFIRTKN